MTLGFDVYIHISEKNILYIHRDDCIEDEQLSRLHKKNVSKLFISKEDFPAYEKFVALSVNSALNDPNVSKTERAQIINGQSKGSVEDFFEKPESPEAFKHTQAAAGFQVALLLKKPEMLEDMLKIAQNDKTTYQHSVNVASIAIGLAALLKAPVETCEMVGLGGLLHDVGLQDTPELLHHNMGNIGPEQREAYQQHPRVGAGKLSAKKHISKDILDIILMHEERLDGQGFPSGVKKVDQIFQLVGLANFYDRQVTFLGQTPQEAYTYIQSLRPAPYDERLIKGLKDVLVANRIY